MAVRRSYQKSALWKSLRKYFGFVAIIVIVAWAVQGAEVSATNIVTGFPNILNYLGRMIPPSASILTKLGQPIAETFQIAIIAIVLASVIAVPLSFPAARNVTTNEIIYQVVRAILGILRGIPPLLWALLFVAMVGLGPFAGVLALTCHVVGSMGRFMSEAIENINPEVIDAAKATGASKTQIIIHAVIPELAALILGYILYFSEYNVRTSTVLGLVGAGGIGTQIIISVHLFQYGEVATIMLILIAIIVTMDRLSVILRTILIRGE